MPTLPFEVKATDLLSDLGVPVCAQRAFAKARFPATTGPLVDYPCVVDSGAPLSVIPYSLWHGRALQWAPLGTTMTQRAKAAPSPLEWLGVVYHLGSTRIHLVDIATGMLAGPYLLVGKFAQARQPKTEVEATAILGLVFLS